MIDIVEPKGNEDEFILMAKQLGFDKLCFLYSTLPVKKKYDFPVLIGLYVAEEKVHSFKGKADLLFVRNGGRSAIDQGCDVLVGVEDEKKDTVHQRVSGLNHILANACVEKQVQVVFDMALLRKKMYVFARMKQNLYLCRKYDVSYRFASFAKHPLQMISADGLMAIERELMKQ